MNNEENEIIEEEEEINDKNENNQNKKENNDAFVMLDKFIQIILYLLKIENKRRKLVIDYYNVYDIKLPKTEIENNKKIEKLLTDKNEVFINNNLQEDDIEDTDSKANTLLSYTRQKLVYEWFINDIIKLKIIIIFVLDIKLNYNKNALFNKLNNKGKEDIKKAEFDKIKRIIFSYIFPENSNKYFYTRYINENPKKTAAAFEKLIFE